MTPQEGDHYFVSSYKKLTPAAPQHEDLFRAALVQLETHIATGLDELPKDQEQARRVLYAESISLLKDAAWPKVGTAFVWLVYVGDVLLDALLAGDACARLITMAWCPLMYRFDGEWCSSDFGNTLANELRQGLESVPPALEAWCAASQVPVPEIP